MKQYAVLYFEAENNSLVHFVFVCQAEDVNHALLVLGGMKYALR